MVPRSDQFRLCWDRVQLRQSLREDGADKDVANQEHEIHAKLFFLKKEKHKTKIKK